MQVIDSKKRIVYPAKDGVFVALSREAELAEGLNWSFLIFDEIHAQKKGDFWNTLKGGGIAREQPLQFSISTAGAYEPHSIGWMEWEYGRKVREGLVADVRYMGVQYYSEAA
jgi:phage terminase large subunit-like protein